MKSVAGAVAQLSQEQINEAEQNGIALTLSDDSTVKLEADDLEVSYKDIPGWLVASDPLVTVALDITITEDLRKEGIARDIVNRIQNMRKDAGMEVQDKIKISIKTPEELIDSALQANKEYICNETQALSLDLVPNLADGKEVEMDDYTLWVKIEK
jgi:isoleucyl-tRNA synthetase